MTATMMAASGTTGSEGALRPALARHVPLAGQSRGGVVESVHYGSMICIDARGHTLLSLGDPMGRFYPRSAMKPLQAVAMVRAGLLLPPDQLAMAAASHSGAAVHQSTAMAILAGHGLDESALANTPDLPYGVPEREQWLRAGKAATRLAQNCSGKHSAMVATCALNSWPLESYLDPGHPLPRLIRSVVEELTGEKIVDVSTDGCGTEVFALSLKAMATAFSSMVTSKPDSAEHDVVSAMIGHPHLVAGEGRDVTAVMRAFPGLLAKDGFEGVQLVALPDGRTIAIKISDGGDRARMPVAAEALRFLGVDQQALAAFRSVPVLGGGRSVGLLQALPITD
jgi:L-asparaginase II